MSEPVDLTNCDREPIHIPGLIQSHGILLSVQFPEFTILQASDSVEREFHQTADSLTGKPLAALLSQHDLERMTSLIATLEVGPRPTYLFDITSSPGATTLHVIAQRPTEDRVILEFEAKEDAFEMEFSNLYHSVERALSKIERTKSMVDLYQASAEEVQKITGFDRVMIYRFDHDWNGSVVAEVKRPDLEPFLGLQYPASDIPVQARELYRRNRLRFISDVDYEASPVLPTLDPLTQLPLDMSLCVLRSVSPIHLEYLRNMGVRASMSISLMKQDQLWGLVACHHYSPRFVSHHIRSYCELLGQMMSAKLTSREELALSDYDARISDVSGRLIENAKQGPNVVQTLLEGSPNILEVFDCAGAAFVLEDKVFRTGQTPSEPEILALSRQITNKYVDGVFQTDCVHKNLNVASASPLAAGIIAVSLSADDKFQVMWFRPERLRTINWAGDPRKSLKKGEDSGRLSPRGSFAVWKQTIRGCSSVWSTSEIQAVKDFRILLMTVLLAHANGITAENRDLLSSVEHQLQLLESERAARTEAERLNAMKDEFVATLSHELRTPLAAILGWSSLLSRGQSTKEDIQQVGEVIERNAKAQLQIIEDLLDMSRISSGKIRLNLETIELSALVGDCIETIQPGARAKEIEIVRSSPDGELAVAGDSVRLRQVIWNLLTNAVKFTNQGGKITVILQREGSFANLHVTDTGKGIQPEFLPYIFERFNQEDASSNRKHGGLGLGLAIVRQLVELHGGSVMVTSEGLDKGSTFTVILPIATIAPAKEAAPDGLFDLSNRHILVVDDEPDVREILRRILADCRANVDTAASADEALTKIRESAYDCVISDVGMPGTDGYSFISRLRVLELEWDRPQIPAIALTAYTRDEDREKAIRSGFDVHLTKPLSTPELLNAIARLTS